MSNLGLELEPLNKTKDVNSSDISISNSGMKSGLTGRGSKV